MKRKSLIRSLAVAGLATGAIAVGAGSAAASTGYGYSYSPSYSSHTPSYSYSPSYRDYTGYSTYGRISRYTGLPRTYSYTRPYYRPSTGRLSSGYWRSSRAYHPRTSYDFRLR